MTRRRLVEAVLLLAAALLFAALLTAPLRHPNRAPGLAAPPPWLLAVDDAYIFVRYARQAARGLPMQWNEGEPSSGASSLLFTLPLVPVHRLSSDPGIWSLWSRGVGVLSLFLLGLATAAALRAAGVAEPWPLAGGLTVVWSGPVGFGAVAGMESALNAALILAACAAWSRALREPAAARWATPLTLVALLPLARPENAFLTLLAVGAALLGRGPRRRGTALLALLPGAGLALLHLAATGAAEPAGALAKSWTHAAFVPASRLPEAWWLTARSVLLPVYAGRTPALWFPVGLLAVATALAVGLAGARALRRHQASPLAPLAPLAAAWAVLFLTAPLSSYLAWQQMRHHHAGLAAAWVLAIAGSALTIEAWVRRRSAGGLAPRWRALALLLPAALLATTHLWAREHTAAATDLFRRHGRAVSWLSSQGRGDVLLLNDAGLIALAHDGPMIDLIGLGTPGLTLAYRHGAGSIVESLARRPAPPTIAAVNPDLLRVPQLLGRPLVPAPAPGGTVVAEVRRELLQGTPLAGPGVDFAWLPDEERAQVRWMRAPEQRQASFALLLPGISGPPRLEGCRPILGGVGLEVPAGTRSIGLRAALLQEDRGALAVRSGGPDAAVEHAITLGRTAWTEARLPWPAGAQGSTVLWLTRQGSALPCLESVRFLPS